MNQGLRVSWLVKHMRDATRAGHEAERRRYERELVEIYQSDPGMRAQVADAFRPFALSFARRLKRGEEPLEDLIQVATFGLLKALGRFDVERGESFTAYAAPTVLGELRRHYRDTGWAVHVPRSGQELAQKINKAAREIAHQGHEPTVARLAEYLEMDVEQIVEGRLAADAMRASSIDRPVDSQDPDARTVADRHGALDAGYDQADARAMLGRLARNMPERDRQILALRYTAGLSQARIGEQVGISQMQVSRELRRIMRDLQMEVGDPA